MNIAELRKILGKSNIDPESAAEIDEILQWRENMEQAIKRTKQATQKKEGGA